jgi:hypothetical protein
MSQVLITPDVISKEILMVLHNSLTFTKGVNREFDRNFANSAVTISGKIGPSLRIRKPAVAVVTDGAALAVQDINEEYVTLPVSTREHIGFAFTAQDLTLTVDDFSGRYLQPFAKKLAAKIDRDGLTNAYKTVYNQVGTAGTTPATKAVVLNAGAKLDDSLAPRDNERTLCLNSSAQASIVENFATLFNQQSAIGNQYESGTMGNAFGFKFSLDQQIPSMTSGDRSSAGTTTVNGTQTGSSLLVTTGAASTFKAGDRFTIGGVYGVNYESKIAYSNLQQFVVLADTAAISTAATLSISPEIIITGPKQTVSAAAVSGQYLTFINGDSTVASVQNMAYHKDAFTLAMAELYLPDGVDFKSRASSDGVSVRVVRDYNINTDQLICRMDVLYGWASLYPQWACAILG